MFSVKPNFSFKKRDIKGPVKQWNIRLRKHCFPNISAFACTGSICYGNIFCVRATKNVPSKLFSSFARSIVSCRNKCFFARKRGNIVEETFCAMFPQQLPANLMSISSAFKQKKIVIYRDGSIACAHPEKTKVRMKPKAKIPEMSCGIWTKLWRWKF